MALVRIRQVLASIRNEVTNLLSAQLGDVFSEQPESQEAETFQHFGFASRPAKAVAGKSAGQVVTLDRSDRDLIVAERDSRAAQMYANLGDGETAVFASAGAARMLCKADGSVNLYTTFTNDDSGRGVFLRITPKEFRFEAPWGRFWFDETGFHIVDRSGARIDGGSLGGLPDPFSQLSSMVTIEAAGVLVDGGNVKLGKGTVYTSVVGNLTPGPVTGVSLAGTASPLVVVASG